MVQLRILSGKKAGSAYVARRFPVQIGRSAKAELQLEEDGVWNEHLRLDFSPGEGFVLSACENALAAVNATPVQKTVLRNGDLIQVGSSKLQFWLSEPRQRSQGLREAFVWALIAAVCIAQVALVYWLLRME